MRTGALASALLILSLLLTAFGGVAESPTMTVRREEEDLWSLSLSADLFKLTAGDPIVLLAEITAPEGWTIREITEGPGAERLILTHGALPAKEVKILLDGRADEDSEGVILWVKTEKNTQNPSKQGGYMGVTGVDSENLTLYIGRGDGHAEVIPVGVEVDPRGWIEETQGGSTESTPEEGASEAPWESMTEILPDREETLSSSHEGSECESDPQLPVFLGCRETEVREGTFAVQFLFVGEAAPVICMEGGGVIYAESRVYSGALGEETWSICTFRGLSAQRRYVFLVADGRGNESVPAVYDGGSFMGFG